MPPFWFGCEFEFCVAFVPQNAKLPDETETRRLRFNLGKRASEVPSKAITPKVSAESIQSGPSARAGLEEFTIESPSSSASSKKEEQDRYDRWALAFETTPIIQEDIAAALTAAAFKAFKTSGGSDFEVWMVDTDGSISPPYATQYLWVPIELKSPALECTPKSLKIIVQVLNLINSTYVTDTGRSTGFHVHLSRGIGKAFKFETLQNLFAFLYAFDPQISTLQPIERQKNTAFADSIRRLSTFVDEFHEKHGHPPTAMQGIVELLQKKNTSDLLDAVRWPFNDKALRYNPSNLFWFLESKHDSEHNSHPPTIEFRQHFGTLEASRIINWIKLLVGIINFVDTADPESLTHLLKKALDEKWQKQGIDHDAEQQEKFGPVPAEGSFTIIDLLRYMNLNELADFYSDKTHELVGIPPIRKPRLWIWEYEQQYAKRKMTDEEFQRQHAMRLLWEQSVTAALAQPEVSSFNFDPDDEMWPVHTPIERVSKNHSGFTFLANTQFSFNDIVIDLSPDMSLIDDLSDGSLISQTQPEIEGMRFLEAIEGLGSETEEKHLYSAD